MRCVIDKETGVPGHDMRKRIFCYLTAILLWLAAPVFSVAIAASETLSEHKLISLKTAQAGQAFKAEEYARAVTLFRELTELNPKDVLSWQYLGQSLAKVKDVMAAQRAYEKVLAIQPEGKIAESTRDLMAQLPEPDLFAYKIDSGLTLGDWMPMAEEQVKQGKRKAVLEKIKIYLDQFGPIPQLQSLQGKLQKEIIAALKIEDAESAKAALPQIRELLGQTPDNLDALRLEARACHLTKEFACAEEAYSAWLSISPESGVERKEVVYALLQVRQHLVPEKPVHASAPESGARKPSYPDLYTLQLDSGITLGDWFKLAEKQSAEGLRENVLRDISQHLKKFGPVPQLLALQERLQQEVQSENQQRLLQAIAAIKVNNAESAKSALLKIRELKAQASGNLVLTGLEAKACHLMLDFSCASTAYASWLLAASSGDPMRDDIVAAALLAGRREALPQPVSPLPPLAATGEVIRDCADCPEMVVISKGSFEMGEPNSKHTVIFEQPFAIGKSEVTQGQWKEIMGNNPSQFQGCGDSCPVDKVSWNDAKEFIRKLNAKTGKLYRLPSEAEWEAACRAGAQQEYCGGDNIESVAWYGAYATPGGNSGKTTHPVAIKQANAWGLYDMSGNVWEWVEDCWHENFNGAPSDGKAWLGDGAKHVVRGGSWVSKAPFARATYRDWDGASDRYYFNGFRLALTLP